MVSKIRSLYLVSEIVAGVEAMPMVVVLARQLWKEENKGNKRLSIWSTKAILL